MNSKENVKLSTGIYIPNQQCPKCQKGFKYNSLYDQYECECIKE